jgi:hypothetical protein
VITLPRALARQFKAVLRKAQPPGAGRGSRPLVLMQAGPDGLRLRAQHAEVALEYHQPGPRPEERLCLPGEALDDVEGRTGAVALEPTGPEAVQARWDDRGVPQVRSYASAEADKLAAFPAPPAAFADPGPGLLHALEDAVGVAARESPRYAITRLQLRGAAGKVVATDGHQLLVQEGFAFPWTPDVLVPALSVFGCRDLPPDAPVTVGRTDKHVGVRVGPWTFLLAIDADGRFPAAEQAIPGRTAGATTAQLATEDAAFLAQALPRLPGGKDEDAPVTLDLNGHVAVRARAGGAGPVTELVLARSAVAGPPVRFATNRGYLARALRLGFAELLVVKPDVPVLCRDGRRTYLWMPLGKEGALPPGDDVVRITAGGEASPPPMTERSEPAMTKPPPNGHANNPPPSGHDRNPPPAPAATPAAEERPTNGTGVGGLIEEARALQEALRDAHGRAGRLLAALRRQRKQSRLMASTLASLRQLQQLHPLDA